MRCSSQTQLITHNITISTVKDKYGSDFEDDDDDSESDSESDESEDEEGEELTPIVDAAILRTLARIRRKDPEIYDAEKNIFGGMCRLFHQSWCVLKTSFRGAAEDSACNNEVDADSQGQSAFK